MEQFFTFVLLGLGPGALIAGIALSVIVTYRGAAAINLAAASVALYGAYTFYGLTARSYLFLPPLPFTPSHIDLGGPMATVPAVLVSVGICAVLGVVLEFAVFRPLRHAAQLAKLVSTLGVFLTIQAIITLRFGGTGQPATAALPNDQDNVIHVFGAVVPTINLELAAIVIAIAAALAAAYRFTRFGIATRAASENEMAASYAGLFATRISLINTVLASMLAGLIGILAAPLTQLDPITIPLVIVPALGAALFAGFTSFGVATATGIGLGILQSLLTWLQTKSWFPTSSGSPLPGVADLLFFVIIIVAMYWRASTLPSRGTVSERRLPPVPSPNRIALPTAIAAVVIIFCFLTFPYDFRQALITSLIGMVVCLSLVIITGFIGQISLIQVALGGVTGFVISKLGVNAGLEFPVSAFLGVMAAVAFGVLTATASLRVRGTSLAIVTLAAAVALQNFGFANSTWGAGSTGSPVGELQLFGLSLGTNADFPINASVPPSPIFGLVCGFVAIGVALLVANIRRSRLGEQMLAIRSDETAASTAGISTQTVKLIAFGLSSFVAGLAGALYAYNFGSVTGGRFGFLAALSLLAAAYVGGITTIPGAILGGLGVTEGLINHALNKWFGVPTSYQLLVTGVLLVAVIALKPEGLAGGRRRKGGETPKPRRPEWFRLRRPEATG